MMIRNIVAGAAASAGFVACCCPDGRVEYCRRPAREAAPMMAPAAAPSVDAAPASQRAQLEAAGRA